jgi:hypothetical protein
MPVLGRSQPIFLRKFRRGFTIPPADTTGPTVTFGSQTATKISRQPGKDSVNITITTNENFVEYELRLVANEDSARNTGNLLESGIVIATTSHNVDITDDELVDLGGGVEGINRIKAFVKDAAGNWSDGSVSTPLSIFTSRLGTAHAQPSRIVLRRY